MFLSGKADHEDPADSAAVTTLRMNSSSQTMTDMFSTTPADLRQAASASWRRSKNLSLAGHGRSD